jgi:pSer/pThr/pTyr-binding forkhead associated (FHA) protein
MSPLSKDFPDKPVEVAPKNIGELKTITSLTPTQAEALEVDKTLAMETPRPKRIKSPEPRRYMLVIATEDGPRMLALRDEKLSIGRLEDNQLCLQHGSVSRHHALLELTKRGLSISDMGSQNGTTVNGLAVGNQVYLKPGDVIRVGYVALFYFGFMSPDDPPQIEVIDGPLALSPLAPDAPR